MQAFADFAIESFASDVTLTWNIISRQQVTARFAVDTLAALVSFEQREPNGPWHVSFDVTRGELTDLELVQSSFQVFNGVFQAVREFVETREPEVIVFATKKDKLASIYGKYLERERPALESLGYKLEAPQRVEPFQEFTLRRVRPSGWNPR